jgi:hypothetical protein
LDTSDLIGSLVAALLTIMVLSYLVGDNPLFKFATHLLIGVAGGYAGAIAIRNVLQPGLVDPLVEAGLPGLVDPDLLVSVVFPWILVIILLLKVSQSTARYGTLPMALLVGVGAAVVVGGAITGTLIPQTQAAMNSSLSPGVINPQTGEAGFERVVGVSVLILGTLSTLFYFRFSALRGETETPLAVVAGITIPGPLNLFAGLGKSFIALVFGVMYAGVLSAAMIVLAERLEFLLESISGLLNSFG